MLEKYSKILYACKLLLMYFKFNRIIYRNINDSNLIHQVSVKNNEQDFNVTIHMNIVSDVSYSQTKELINKQC